ncbi:MAG TPA: carbohydrate-binding protein [Candidatus Rifleibacterium sp.]|nr:carbohydrate-binding protein [Candidatus Rifleibacterium sp.]
MTTETGAVVHQIEPGRQKASLPEGVAHEVPSTRPFEGFSYLKKEWLDREDNIESVTLSLVFGHLNRPPDWKSMQSFTMMPEWGSAPLKRSWVLRIPTHFEGAERYLFHYFFQIRYTDGSDKVSDNFTQLIMPREIEYIDHSGACTHVRLHWSLDNWAYPQDTELEADGIEWNSEFSVSHAPYRHGDPLYERGRTARISGLPMPRVFRATIWGPHREVINYCFSLIAVDQSGNQHQKWDNNDGENFKLTI